MHRAFASWSDNHKAERLASNRAASLARAARGAPARRPAQDINFVEVTEECKAIGQDHEGCELAEVFVTALAKPEQTMATYRQDTPRLPRTSLHLHPTSCTLAVRPAPHPHSLCRTTLALALALTSTLDPPPPPRPHPHLHRHPPHLRSLHLRSHLITSDRLYHPPRLPDLRRRRRPQT